MNQSLHKLQAAQMPTLARNSWAALLLGRDAWKRCQFPRAHPPCISLSFQTGTLFRLGLCVRYYLVPTFVIFHILCISTVNLGILFNGECEKDGTVFYSFLSSNHLSCVSVTGR